METRIVVSDALEAQRSAVSVEEREPTRQRIRRFAERELALRRERLERAEAKETQELDLRRRYDQDRRAVRDQLPLEPTKTFKLDRGDYGGSIEDREPQAAARQSDAGMRSREGAVFGLKVEPVSALKAHPYRLYFNWPALREDRVTGKAD